MQFFFAISCLLAVMALANGAPNADREVGQPRAEVGAQDVVASDSEQASEDIAADQQTADEAAVEVQSSKIDSTSGNEENQEVAREKRTLLHHLLTCGFGGARPCGCGALSPCGQQGGTQPNPVPPLAEVVYYPVPVPQPVQVPVPVEKVVHHFVPVPQRVPIAVAKFVPVPVPIELPQTQRCCDQAPCSSCSG